MMMFPGLPLPSINVAIPSTKASITVNNPITAVKASAVMIVVFQRTVRFRTL